MHTSSLKGYFLFFKLIHQNLIYAKGGGGVCRFMTFSDKGGDGVGQLWLTRGGRGGVWTHPFLADVIC